MKNLILGLLKEIQNYDITSSVIIEHHEYGEGYFIKQTLNDGSAGILMYLTNDLVLDAFNHGWQIDKEYLGNISDFLINLLERNEITISIDGDMLYHCSKSFKNKY